MDTAASRMSVATTTKWLAVGLAATLVSLARAADLQTGTFPFADIDVHYQMYDTGNKEDPAILFLHGRAFTSDVWVKQGTLQAANEQKFRAIAVDLPGYGKTKHLPYVDNNMRAEFIKATLEFAAQKRQNPNVTAVLVTPSMSGRWAIPFLDRYGQMLCGWVPVAPVGVKSWGGPWEYTHKQVKLLALYGENDPMKEDGDYLSKLFYTSTLVTIAKAGHACYMDNPKDFNQQIIDFLHQVEPENLVLDQYHNAKEL